MNINIIKNDEFVKDLTDEQLSILEAIAGEYNCETDVHLHETIHGHIATLHKAKGHYIPASENSAARLTMQDLAFLQQFDIRWIEAYHGRLVVAV